MTAQCLRRDWGSLSPPIKSRPSENGSIRERPARIDTAADVLLTCGKITEEDRNFWAFRPLARPTVPKVKGSQRVRTAIDAFLLSKLESKGLTFSANAPKWVLMRRAYFDLVGLPPSPDEVRQFVSDSKTDAYERMIDRLLDSPHYGERWGRHWLDVAGYTDEASYASELVRSKAGTHKMERPAAPDRSGNLPAE